MTEFVRNTGELPLPNTHIAMISRGIETHLTVTGNAIHAENAQGNIGIMLDEPDILFVRTQLENPDRSFLSSELRLKQPGLQNFSIARLYTSLTSKFGPQNVRDNFIAFGHGSAKRYGFLTDSSDPSKLIQEGRRLVELSEHSKRRKSKQLRSFDELEAFFNGSEERKYSRKKVLGATALATTITIGGTMFLIYKNSHTE
jgi:hypothetical protein